MTSTSRLVRARLQIESFLNEASVNVYSEAEIAGIVEVNREKWNLEARTGATDVITFLAGTGKLELLRAISPYGNALRYAWGEYSAFDAGASLRRTGYFSHASAIFLHGLSDQIPRTLYLNQEQTPKPQPSSPLTQEALNKAFSRPQRQSNFVYTLGKWRLTIVSGKSTGRLGVDVMRSPTGHSVLGTTLERTLIDIAVRPAYGGGVYEVLAAFRESRGRVDISRLVGLLGQLNYVYPYHQAIGFYLERAGHDGAALRNLRDLRLEFDFYLAHGLREKDYDPSWRIYYPKGL